MVVATRAAAGPAGALNAPRGRWLDVLGGGVRSFSGRSPAGAVLDGHAVAVFERVGR